MKKLMIAACAVAFAAVAQAASVSWTSGKIYAPSDPSDLTFDSADVAVGSDAKFLLWYVNADTFNDTSIDSIYGTYHGTKADASFDTSSSKVAAAKDGLNIGDTVYALALIEYGDYYIANKFSATVTDMGGEPVSPIVSKVDTKVGGQGGNAFEGSGAAITAWQTAAVPEPTSGLLLLLGVAGLALRRRRA